MSCKEDLIKEVDDLIHKHGKKNPALLRDLQSHRNAITNALSKKEMANLAFKIFAVAKFIYDSWPD